MSSDGPMEIKYYYYTITKKGERLGWYKVRVKSSRLLFSYTRAIQNIYTCSRCVENRNFIVQNRTTVGELYTDTILAGKVLKSMHAAYNIRLTGMRCIYIYGPFLNKFPSPCICSLPCRTPYQCGPGPHNQPDLEIVNLNYCTVIIFI
jgi:hypothetical protein